MTKTTLFSLVSTAFALAIGLTVQTASALPCCSACYPGNPVCKYGCSPSCEKDDEPAPVAGVYDEAAGLCYAAE